MNRNSTAFFVALMLLSTALIPLGDAAAKGMTGMGVSPAFAAWSRFGLGAILLAPVLGLTRRDLAQLLDYRLYLRAIGVVGGISFIILAQKTEPLADAFGAFFIGPIVAFGLARLWLGERASAGRVLLLLIGFAGVMLVVKPGFGMRIGLVYALLSGCFNGYFLVANRWLAGAFRPQLMLFSQLLFGAIILAPIGAPAMPELSVPIVWLMVASALASGAANWLLVYVSGHLTAQIIAPLVYTQLIGAVVYGLVFFGDWPDVWALIGLIVILASGLGALALRR